MRGVQFYRYDPGPTLCRKHAYQVVRLGIDGDCEPESWWFGGHGQVVTCDVVADPARVEAYVERVVKRRPKTQVGEPG